MARVFLLWAVLLIGIILAAPLAAAALIRSVSQDNCPLEAGKRQVEVNLVASGFDAAYTIVETVPSSWVFSTQSKYSRRTSGGLTTYSIYKYRGELVTNYTLRIPQSYGSSGTISGSVYTPSGIDGVIGQNSFLLKSMTCAGTSDDPDGDGWGRGCGCPVEPDCDETNRYIHPGAAEPKGPIDYNCDGRVCNPIQTDPSYFFTDPCTGPTEQEKRDVTNSWLAGQIKVFIDLLARYVPQNYVPPTNVAGPYHSDEGTTP